MSDPQESDPKNNFRPRGRRSYMAHTLFTHKFTCVRMLTLRDSRNPPLDLLTGVLPFQPLKVRGSIARTKFLGIRDREFLSEIFSVLFSQIAQKMIEQQLGDKLRKLIQDDQTQDSVSYYARFYSDADYGTTHLAVLAKNGDAVSVTSTINHRLVQ